MKVKVERNINCKEIKKTKSKVYKKFETFFFPTTVRTSDFNISRAILFFCIPYNYV